MLQLVLLLGKAVQRLPTFSCNPAPGFNCQEIMNSFLGQLTRVIMISGGIDDVIKAIELVLSKLISEINIEEGDEVDPRTKVRVVVPNSFCGGIIGRGGSTIKSFIEESRAGIKISPQDNSYYGTNDQLITLTGTLEEQMRAIDLVLFKLSVDPHYSQSANVPFSYAAAYNNMGHGPPSYGGLPAGTGGKFHNNKEDRSSSMTIGIADDHIGLVVDCGGRTIMDISQATGAKIKISDRGDFLSSTTDWKVTITGSQRSILAAESLIMQKVAVALEKVEP